MATVFKLGAIVLLSISYVLNDLGHRLGVLLVCPDFLLLHLPWYIAKDSLLTVISGDEVFTLW